MSQDELEIAKDELEIDRNIYYQFEINTEKKVKVLCSIENNIKTFDLGREPINFWDYNSEISIDDYLKSKAEEKSGKIVTNPPAWVRKAVGAHANAYEIVKFMKESFFPDNINSCYYYLFVRFSQRTAYNWGKQQVLTVFGDTESDVSLSASETMVAHELFHSVSRRKVEFIDKGMAGALSESYSDIFAVLFKNRNKNENEDWDWDIGSEFSDSSLQSRDLSNPEAKSITAYRDTNLPSDNSYNSGIHNYAAYLILNRRKENGQRLLTAQQGAKLFYFALSETALLNTKATFSQSLLALISAANKNFDSDLNLRVSLAIQSAFRQVGIML